MKEQQIEVRWSMKGEKEEIGWESVDCISAVQNSEQESHVLGSYETTFILPGIKRNEKLSSCN